MKHDAIPVIDLFAGPGGLGEGFAALAGPDGRPAFRLGLSVEKDPFAHRTLSLRAFYRRFPRGRAPEAYYDYLRRPSDAARQSLFDAYPNQATAAAAEAWHATLGTPAVTDAIDRRITAALAGEPTWVLIGGPPCQGQLHARVARGVGSVPPVRDRHASRPTPGVFQYAVDYHPIDFGLVYVGQPAMTRGSWPGRWGHPPPRGSRGEMRMHIGACTVSTDRTARTGRGVCRPPCSLPRLSSDNADRGAHGCASESYRPRMRRHCWIGFAPHTVRWPSSCTGILNVG